MDLKIKQLELVTKTISMQSDLISQVEKFQELLKKHNSGIEVSLDHTIEFLLKHALDSRDVKKHLKPASKKASTTNKK